MQEHWKVCAGNDLLVPLLLDAAVQKSLGLLLSLFEILFEFNDEFLRGEAHTNAWATRAAIAGRTALQLASGACRRARSLTALWGCSLEKPGWNLTAARWLVISAFVFFGARARTGF